MGNLKRLSDDDHDGIGGVGDVTINVHTGAGFHERRRRSVRKRNRQRLGLQLR
jgi:hypothetical protein